jgi:nucleotide-binding universal stress UspA family protein
MHLLALRTVLVATDLDGASAAAIQTARALASAAGASLHVVHVDGAGPTATVLDAVDGFLRRCGVPPTARHTHVLVGDPAHSIRLLADQIKADVIVVGPHRERVATNGKRALGSTALAVVTESFAPCLVARSPLRVPLDRVLVAVDQSDAARGALIVGLSWASALRAPAATTQPSAAATMLVLHVEPASAAVTSTALQGQNGAGGLGRELERIRRDAGPWAGVSIEAVTHAADDPAAGIVAAAAERRADLIVVGTRGLGLDHTGRLGSVADRLVRTLEIPLLLVPPAVWTSYAAAMAS